MKSKDQRVPILLTRVLIILDMNAGNGLAISLSVYLSLSKNRSKTKQNKTTQNKNQNDQEKRKKNFPPRVVEPQTYDVKGQRDIHRAKATLNVKQKLHT